MKKNKETTPLKPPKKETVSFVLGLYPVNRILMLFEKNDEAVPLKPPKKWTASFRSESS